ncbi:GntR family transcriptional regulator [Thalassospira alkalitolerans]|uniref:GntR family transcriptional regulator n=1 Tax=Thalassospira alkalitolerans TaxID=1293890 RepID=UPI003AA9AF08
MPQKNDQTNDESSLYQLMLMDLADGLYPPGSPMRVHALAKKYKTSVNPIREALRRLEGEGLVTFERNKGATVTKLNRQDIINIFDVVRLIEPYLVINFASKCNAQDVKELTEIHARLKEVPVIDRYQFGIVDTEFHMRITKNHPNPRAVHIWQSQRQLMNTLNHRQQLTKGRYQNILAEHDELIDAFRNNDVQRATEVIGKHVDGAGRALIYHLDQA